MVMLLMTMVIMVDGEDYGDGDDAGDGDDGGDDGDDGGDGGGDDADADGGDGGSDLLLRHIHLVRDPVVFKQVRQGIISRKL